MVNFQTETQLSNANTECLQNFTVSPELTKALQM